jgi:hypothetical protein
MHATLSGRARDGPALIGRCLHRNEGIGTDGVKGSVLSSSAVAARVPAGIAASATARARTSAGR